MTDVVLTTNVELNQDGTDGRVRAVVYEDTGSTQNSANLYVAEGWDSNVLSGFKGQDGFNEYSVTLTLYNDGEQTLSPVVHQATIDVPDINTVIGTQTTTSTATPLNVIEQSETTEVTTPTSAIANPQFVTELSTSSETTQPTSVEATPSYASQEFSEFIQSSQTTGVNTSTQAFEYAETTVGTDITDVHADPTIAYPWVNVFRTSQTTSTEVQTFAGTIEYNEIAVYEQRIGANIDHIKDSWSNNAIPFGEATGVRGGPPNIYKLARSISGVLDGFDYRTNVVHTNIHVSYATGKSLDRIGNLANCKRKNGESDKRYRKRIIVTMRASVTGTTYNEVASFTSTLLETDVRNVTFDFRPQEFPATLFVLVDEGDIESTPFTAVEIADLLDRTVPADHDVVLELQGDFLFKNIGEADEPEHGFTTTPASDDVGGTLKGEIGQ